jgi:signal peptidase II
MPGSADSDVASAVADDVETADTGPAGEGEASSEPRATTWSGPSIGRWVLFAAIAIGVLVLDQLSKAWITSNLEIGESVEVLGEWLRLVHWRNTGALFGLLPQSAPVFAVISIGVVGLIVLYHRKAGRGIVTTIALALLLGGAVGNLVDRLRYGSVVDFVDMGIGQWRFYTYNVADAAITTAIILLLAMAVFPRIGDWGADRG